MISIIIINQNQLIWLLIRWNWSKLKIISAFLKIGSHSTLLFGYIMGTAIKLFERMWNFKYYINFLSHAKSVKMHHALFYAAYWNYCIKFWNWINFIVKMIENRLNDQNRHWSSIERRAYGAKYQRMMYSTKCVMLDSSSWRFDLTLLAATNQHSSSPT